MSNYISDVMDDWNLDEIRANGWNKVGIFVLQTLSWWNIVMNDWNLDEKPPNKWQWLQLHPKSIILHPKFTRIDKEYWAHV